VGPVAVDHTGRLLVADPSGRKLALVAANGTPLHAWGGAGTGNGQFNGQFNPGIGGVAVAPDGTIYATDTWNGRVEEFTPSGTFVRAWGKQNLSQDKLGPYDFYGPRGVAVAPNGNLYVADTGHKRIQVFDKDGKFLFGFGAPGSLPGQFNEPSSVAVDASGKVYVADYWNQRVQVLDAQGHPLVMFTVTSWQNGSYDEPYIAVDGRGDIYVPDPDDARVLEYSPTGKPVMAWGTITLFGKPLSVAVGPNHTILVGDSANSRVLQFTAP
jgi:DNA-binding beta-propeller fold protein YncE